MKIKEICDFLELIAPLNYQENYDNAGLLVGEKDWEVTQALIALDTTEAVIDEAIERNCNLVIAHHPIIFKGLKRLTGSNYIERAIIKAIKNNIAIYVAHTNLDNVKNGVNQKICDKIGIVDTRILVPKRDLLHKIQVLCPIAKADVVRQKMLDVGGGMSGAFSASSFNHLGISSPEGSATAVSGMLSIEMVYLKHLETKILSVLEKFHPEEYPTYTISPVLNSYRFVGSGMIGELKEPMSELAFLKHLKAKMNAGMVKYTPLRRKKVKRVAVCGGAGGFLLKDAIRQGADVFVTSDYKYHEFFDANGGIIIADIGHYESEQFTKDLFCELLKKKFSTFVPLLANTNTNPVKYL